MSAHTPGPWRLGTGMDGTVVCDAQHDGNHLMTGEDLSFYGGYLLAESIMRKVDAQLMAAAPDLLGALEMVRDADEDCRRDDLPTIPSAARARIDAAITKARAP